MELEALHDIVIVRMDVQSDRSPGGILIPDSAKTKLRRGTVVAVGPGKPVDGLGIVRCRVKPGDRVIFKGFEGSEVEVKEIQEEKLLFISEQHILAIMHEGETDAE